MRNSSTPAEIKFDSKQVQCSFALFVYSPSNLCIAAQGFFSHNFRTLTLAGSMCAWHTFCATHLIFKFERAVCAPSTCPDLTPENYVLETLFSFSLSSLLLVLRCRVLNEGPFSRFGRGRLLNAGARLDSQPLEKWWRRS